MCITIIEPHGDDALISCSSVLAGKNSVKVVTVFDDRSSKKLSEYYPNVEIVELNFDRFRGTQYSERPKASEFTSGIERREPVWENWRDKILEDNEKLYGEILAALQPYAVGTVYTLIGCLHAQHIMCREAVLSLNPDGAVFASEPAIRYRRVGMLAERAAVKALDPKKIRVSKPAKNKMAVFKKVYSSETYLIRSKSLEDDFTEPEVFWKC